MKSNIKEIRDICCGSSYTDRYGQNKTRWTKVGVMFIKEDGKISMLFDAFPTQTNSLVAFEQKPRDGQGRPAPGEQGIPTIEVPPPSADGEVPPDTEIPVADEDGVNVEDIPF
jgi:hypothetical protein